MLYILNNLVTMVAWKLKFKVHSFREIFALITLIIHNKRFECVFGSFNKKMLFVTGTKTFLQAHLLFQTRLSPRAETATIRPQKQCLLQSAQKCGSKFFDWSRKMTLFYRDLFYAWQRRYLN
jgi:hypothetical protein